MTNQSKIQIFLTMLLLVLFTLRASGIVPSNVAINIKSPPKPQPAFVNEIVVTSLSASFYLGDPKFELDPPANTQYNWTCPTITRDGTVIVQDSKPLVKDAPTVSFSGGQSATMSLVSTVKGMFECTVRLDASSPDWKDSSGNSITLCGYYQITIIITDVRLRQVTYGGSGFRNILQDDYTKPPYGAPQWLDMNHDGNAIDSDIKEPHFPLCYTHGSEITLSAQFDVSNGAQLPSPIPVRCSSSTGLRFPVAQGQVNGQSITVSMTSIGGLPEAAAYYNPFKLTWEISRDGGVSWKYTGTSDNRLYLTLGDPGSVQESVLDIACRNLSGEMTDKSKILDAIWSAFHGPMPGIRRKPRDGYNAVDGSEMRYWPEGYRTPEYFVTKDLIRTMEGRCGAWADLFIIALGVHGIISENENINPPHNILPPGYIAHSPWDRFGAYWLCVDPTHPGQGNSTPEVITPDQGAGLPSRFNNHAVVRVTNPPVTAVYDPSYAMYYKNTNNDLWENSKMEWENLSIRLYVVWATNGGPTVPIEVYDNRTRLDTIWTP